MDGEKRKSKLWGMYEHGRAYQATIGLLDQIPKNVDFYEGRQWPPATESTKDLPRPVVNFVKFIVRNKKSGIVGSPVSVVYTSNSDPEKAERLTEFNRAVEAEMEMEDLRNRMVHDGIVKCSGFIHYYWDADAVSEPGNYVGGVRAEVIDPLNIFFANPRETDEQKQKWILIASRVELDAVKAMADGSVRKDDIVPDDLETEYTGDTEQEGSRLVTVLTRYFRKDGEVYYERATKGVMLHKPIALTPELVELNETAATDGENGEDSEDAVESELPDKPDKTPRKMTLYPIQAYAYETREKCIYGMGEVDGIIPNQKCINFNLAMQLLAVQNQAWGKYIVKSGALKEQKITNTPGQVLNDYSAPGTWGIKRLEEPAFSQMPMQLVDTIMNLTRTITGSTEVMTGEQVSSSQSGAAIANLQSQALKPMQELRDRYMRSCKRGARIVLQFYRLFYDGKPFERINGDEYLGEELFNGAEYADTYFDVNVEASATTPYSESLNISLLGEFLTAGYIDFTTYLELLPAQIATFKDSLKKRLTESQSAQLKNAEEMLQQYQTYLEQMQKQLQAQGQSLDNVDSIIRKNRQLQELLASLQTEYTAKIQQANQLLTAQATKNAETQADAETMATMLAMEGQNLPDGSGA